MTNSNGTCSACSIVRVSNYRDSRHTLLASAVECSLALTGQRYLTRVSCSSMRRARAATCLRALGPGKQCLIVAHVQRRKDFGHRARAAQHVVGHRRPVAVDRLAVGAGRGCVPHVARFGFVIERLSARTEQVVEIDAVVTCGAGEGLHLGFLGMAAGNAPGRAAVPSGRANFQAGASGRAVDLATRIRHMHATGRADALGRCVVFKDIPMGGMRCPRRGNPGNAGMRPGPQGADDEGKMRCSQF